MSTAISIAIVISFILSLIVWMLHNVTIGDTYAKLFTTIEQDVKQEISDKVSDGIGGLRDTITSLEEMAKANTAKLEVNVAGHIGVVEGMRHRQLERLVTLVANRLSVMLVGMAGTGKTHAAQQCAEALGREFYAMSVGAQTSKSDIIGYMHAGGDYVDTLFRRAYEHGGVFLMDEIDAGNANVLIQINAALANEYCAFPDQMVKRHDDFVFVGSANTYGTGANRQYVGRNQLDAATLDRFTILEWEIDSELEKHLAGDQQAWYNAMRAVRRHVSEEGLRVLVTPRATQRGAVMLAAGIELDQVADMAILGMFPADKKDRIRDIIKEHYKTKPKVEKSSSGNIEGYESLHKALEKKRQDLETFSAGKSAFSHGLWMRR